MRQQSLKTHAVCVVNGVVSLPALLAGQGKAAFGETPNFGGSFSSSGLQLARQLGRARRVIAAQISAAAAAVFGTVRGPGCRRC